MKAMTANGGGLNWGENHAERDLNEKLIWLYGFSFRAWKRE